MVIAQVKTLKEYLADWVQPEDAKYYLGCVLGLLELHEKQTDNYYAYMTKSKGVYAGGTSEHDTLHTLLQQLVYEGMLEKDDQYKYRWNPAYKSYWEL